ncbi:HIT domain-containing protein [Chrysiogenes arsenatis]|uniref:HIT domain-containing protein n=1 Tax=Chrysiogenes arsenatis TaxID=309797 RepID=UPI000483DD93|nr:HIT family protein [Chrysiogenes arsenatis]
MSQPLFQLHPRLREDTHGVASLELCEVLLMNESRYPWCILVPRRDAVREIYELSVADQQQLWQETTTVLAAMAAEFNADKMNMGALGNIVEQLHIHCIARLRSDAAWPAPVWGKFTPEPYTPEAAAERVARLRQILR